MYSPGRRKYYSKKYYRNRLFAPSLTKANMPNYYQMKGRIIQQTPSRIQEPPTEMITREILDKYYQKLLEYKYPLQPIPEPIPPIDFETFEYNFRTGPITMDNWPEEINLNYLYQNYVQTQIANLPSPPDGYEYAFQLFSINFAYNLPIGTTDSSLYSLTWNTPISSAPQLLVGKTTDVFSAYQIQFSAEVFAVPISSNTLRIGQVTFTNSNYFYRFSTFSSNDELVTDDAFYPLINSKFGSETYDSKIAIDITGVSAYAVMRYNISIFLVPIDL